MESISRSLAETSGDPAAPFFGFMGAAAALVFSCAWGLNRSAWSCSWRGEGGVSWPVRKPCLCASHAAGASWRAGGSITFGVQGKTPASDTAPPLLQPREPTECFPPSYHAHNPVFAACAGFGAAYGTAKSGVGIASMGVMRPELVMKSIVPVVMAGVLGIYGLIIAVIISTGGVRACAAAGGALEA